jgi:cell division protein FtsI (penicillin-binding protein 3)
MAQLYSSTNRDRLLIWVALLIFLLIFGRAFYIQVYQSDFFLSEGNKRQVRLMNIPAPRGNIYDRNGHLLALSTRVDSIWVDPKIISVYLMQRSESLRTGVPLKSKTAKVIKDYSKVASILGLAESSLTLRILDNSNRRFMYLKRSVLPEQGDKIDQLNIPGLYVQNEYKRYYPEAEITGHLVGFTDIDDRGISGIEKVYDDWLSGEAGKKQVVKDRSGHVISFVKDLKPSEAGKHIYLSLDKEIQFFLYKAVKKTQIMHDAKSVESAILDARTGEVLAMVSYPGFNPNDRSQLKGFRLRDRVVTDRVEPGSTMKPFILAKAIDLGLLGVDEKVNTSPGAYRLQGQLISDPRDHGEITPAKIIQKSSNVGVSKVALRMEAYDEWKLFDDLGFGHSLGLFLPGEAEGSLKLLQDWTPLSQATAAYGYGLDVSVMQLAHAYLVFANQGRIKPVTVLKSETIPESKPVFTPETTQAVLEMMETVASAKGTAPKAKVEGYRVAGKTGTVHRLKSGSYDSTKHLSLFAGVIPVSNPRYVMVTCVTEPSRGVFYGGQVAAPVFKEVMTEVVKMAEIEPDEVYQSQ